jgi:hypothetical protein
LRNLQGSLTSADDTVFDGFSTIFVSSPALHLEALDLPKADHAIVVAAWSLPRVNFDAVHSDSNLSCSADGSQCGDNDAPAFHFDTHLPEQYSLGLSSSSARGLSICFPNEHVPHPLEQLQPCFDAHANVVLLLRLPLLVVDAISMSKGGEAGMPRAFSAGKTDLIEADGKCMLAAAAASKNGAYM